MKSWGQGTEACPRAGGEHTRVGRRRRAQANSLPPHGVSGGFTLLEVMVAMCVITIMLSAWITMYVAGIRQSVETASQTSASASAQNAINYIDRDAKSASLVASTVTITTPSTAAGTFVPDNNTLVLKLPGWDAATSTTISGIYDIVIYQYVRLQTDLNASVHNAYNMRRICSPGAGSSRKAEDRWMFPYDVNYDTVTPSLKRSDPWIDYIAGASNKMFVYYVQDSANPGQVIERTSEAWDRVVLIQTQYISNKMYRDTTVQTPVATRSRFRNWQP